jgi:hypothetical protein
MPAGKQAAEFIILRMKLQQGQIWRTGNEYLRIVHLERLEVKYKSMAEPASGEGTHHHVTKKQFCRLIKNGTLIAPVPPDSDLPAE